MQKTPDKTAVVYKEKKFTYAEIDEITDRIAGYVHSKGIGKEEVVSILIPRCEYMPIASIGVLKSGAAYQPLDPSYPPERLQFMIKDANATLLIADENLLELLPDYSGDILLTKDIPNLPKSDAEITKPSPDDLFILIYTSGSTGTPKGAMLEHKMFGHSAIFISETLTLTNTALFRHMQATVLTPASVKCILRLSAVPSFTLLRRTSDLTL